MNKADFFLSVKESEAVSTVGQLKLWTRGVGLDVKTADVEQSFLNDAALPGFIVHANEKVYGVLSRRILLTAISQPFGREVFIKRPIRELAAKMDAPPLILPHKTTISSALKLSMSRADDLRFEPVLVNMGDSVALLEIHVLMIAQANLLEDALTSKSQLIAKIKAVFGSTI